MFTGLEKLREEQQPFSNGWNEKIAEKYLETLKLASCFTSSIESQRFGKTRFLAFYQPFQVPEELVSAHSNIKSKIRSLEYAFDVSSEFDLLGKDIYSDIVHVNQRAKEVMGKKIAKIIATELQLGKAILEK